MSLLESLPHTCDIRIRVRSKGALGGSKDTLTDVTTGVECWQQPASDSERIEYQKRGIVVTNKVYFTSDPEVTERNVLVMDNVEYEVRSRSKPDASAGLGILYRVMVEYSTGDA